ncbi:probable pectinesterase/pectinesterase inhibitor 59 [Actinidia eriantha]|uniref:probable pectinesterase/pectinesterase inhibitor 59 n=1 Tax=Actinidia eriantha TaxID=165200 RepID=UPI00258B08C3|nr:probable pectinesterase/pectinesterase inhibitor 59 [Actinidia eriantha]
MAMKLGLFLVFFLPFSSFLSLAQPDKPPSGMNYWCSTTPHPEQCKIFIGSHHLFVPKHRTDFRTMVVQVAMERALHVQIHMKELRNHCHSKHEKAVWTDCSKLISNTIFQLNNTIQGLKTTKNCTGIDAQTWLSTALTNLETCRVGSVELNVSRFISPILSNNVSELISNSLAINGGFLGKQKTRAGFPSWVSDRERRLLQSPSLASQANYVVGQEGSGHFRSIQAAINYAVSKRRGNERIIIYVKKGVYRENIEISNYMNKLTLVGDGLRYTVITGSRSVATGFTTYSSATVGVDGVGFIARGITFRNTAGPQNGQAVALRSASDLSVFYACAFEGYQDTLFVLAQRQFFKACYIYGTIDFIFGNAAVVFQNCIIYVRKPLWGQANVITAQGRADPFQNTGISIQNSRVIATPELNRVVSSYKTYLGRPWQQYSRTVFLKTYLGSLVDPAGWLAWQNSNFAQDTLYYGEYLNFGPASSTIRRINWKGYHVIRSSSPASQFTVTNLIAGSEWLPATGVPFIAGL